jgi:hypothetical protein
VGIKKNLLPNKINPAAVRLKASTTTVNSNSAEKRAMVAAPEAIPKSAGRKPGPTPEEIDEDVLQDLHSEYLRTRLMAQIALKKSRLAKEKAATAVSKLAVKQTLDKEKVTAQVHSLRRIQSQAEHLVKIQSLQKIIDPLVEKIITEDMERMNEELCENLSSALDVLLVKNATASLEDIQGKELAEINESINSAQENPGSSLGCLHGLKQDEIEFHRLVEGSKTEDREVNEKLMNMMSMKLSLRKVEKK